MLSLRQKLLIGFGGLFLIIALIGIRGIVQVSALGHAIHDIMRENYKSVVACQDMKDTIERIDDGVLFVLLGHEPDGLARISTNLPAFEKALGIELNNITLPGEGELAEKIRVLFTRYKTLVNTLEDVSLPPSDMNQLYFSELMPLFKEIRDTAEQILSMNQENMHQAGQMARHKAAVA